MIGYVQLYFKIVGKKEVYYAAIDTDFRAPLTRFRLWKTKQCIKRIYKEIDTVYSVEFCGKEEYEKYQLKEDEMKG